jgi:hypothetical protein
LGIDVLSAIVGGVASLLAGGLASSEAVQRLLRRVLRLSEAPRRPYSELPWTLEQAMQPLELGPTREAEVRRHSRPVAPLPTGPRGCICDPGSTLQPPFRHPRPRPFLRARLRPPARISPGTRSGRRSGASSVSSTFGWTYSRILSVMTWMMRATGSFSGAPISTLWASPRLSRRRWKSSTCSALCSPPGIPRPSSLPSASHPRRWGSRPRSLCDYRVIVAPAFVEALLPGEDPYTELATGTHCLGYQVV